MGGFNFNPVLSEIQSHMQAMSPEAQAAVRMANPSLPSPQATTAASAPSVIPPGMLLPHPDTAPPAGNITMPSSAPSLSPTQPSLVTGPKMGQAMMTNGESVPRGTPLGEQAELGRLLDTGSGISQIGDKIENSRLGEAHPFLGKLLGGVAQGAATAGDIALRAGGGGFGELAERMIPGTEGHHQLLVNQEGKQVNAATTNAQKEAQTASANATAGKTNAETPEVVPEAEARIGAENATAGHENAETANLQNQPAKYEETSAGPMMIHPDGTAQPVTADGKPLGPPLKLTYQTVDAPDGPHVYGVDEKGNKVVDLGKHYERPTVSVNAGEKNLWSITQPDGTKKVISIKAGDTIPKGAVSLAGQNTEDVAAGKPTADEQRRADLAENLKENFGQLRDIIARRPELFGPLSGRWAELKQKFGTDDPDLAALQTIEHQVGMAQVSAHGMRSAQGVQSAADSIMNHLHDGPKGILSALDAAEKSVGTFTGDVENKENPTAQQPSSGKQNDPLGIR